MASRNFVLTVRYTSSHGPLAREIARFASLENAIAAIDGACKPRMSDTFYTVRDVGYNSLYQRRYPGYAAKVRAAQPEPAKRYDDFMKG